VYELREHHDGNAYRVVYLAKLKDKIYVLHCFQKKSTHGIATPSKDMDLIVQRLKLAIADRKGGTARSHMIRIDVLDPNQDPMPFMSQEISSSRGTTTIRISTAFNDPVGRWICSQPTSSPGCGGEHGSCLPKRRLQSPTPTYLGCAELTIKTSPKLVTW
jgi:Phage derived protein Gp49-like (DUF891)